jgi:ribonuclease HI
MPSWKRRGWRRAEKPIKNLELWKRLDELATGHQVTFIHVRGHSGHVENERCDELAVAASRQFA